MRWQGRRASTNVQDRRGAGPGMIAGGGIGAVILTILALVLGVDPSAVVPTSPTTTGSPPAANDSSAQFAAVIMGTTEDVWGAIFPEKFGRPYQPAGLVLFSGGTSSQCGFAQSAVGPFYCPLDQQVYLDLDFYEDLARKLGAPGDFAQAYVIAHEVGHHVQTLIGVTEQVQGARQSGSEAESNELSVRTELQADCFAGVWANRGPKEWQILDPGDVEEALGAASAVGDDRLQRAATGQIVPESFTHGTSEQRSRWFGRGFQSGDPNTCDTFGAAQL
jgi:uncharacterized protein